VVAKKPIKADISKMALDNLGRIHIPFTDATGVRIPVGTPILNAPVDVGGVTAHPPPIDAEIILAAASDQTHIYG
jgi:hypothetical protein